MARITATVKDFLTPSDSGTSLTVSQPLEVIFGSKYKGVLIPNTFMWNNVHAVEQYAQVLRNGYMYPLLIKRTDKVTTLTANKARAVLAKVYWTETRQHSYVGADPEIFLVDDQGSFVPAFSIYKTREKKRYNETFADGVVVEWNTHPVTCLDTFVHRNKQHILDIINAAGSHRFRVTMQNTFDIPSEELSKYPTESIALGCTPSINVYGESSTIPSMPAHMHTIRSAGGHLHFSLDGDDRKNIASIVRLMDIMVGVPSVGMFQYWDTPLRRMFYGRAGEHRTPKHGLEYRVLSNAWCVSGWSTYAVYELARRAIALARKPNARYDISKIADDDRVRSIINNCDVAEADKYIRKNAGFFDELFASLPLRQDSATDFAAQLKAFKSIVKDGLHTKLENPDVPLFNSVQSSRMSSTNLLKGVYA